MTAATEPLIEVRGLTAVAGETPLLRGVDLDVPPDAVTALVGPSGSGKTTTALALLGEAAPGVRLSGSVRVAGTDVVDHRGPTAAAAALRGGTLAYMPQHPAATLNPARRTGPVLRELALLHADTPPGRTGRGERRRQAEAAAVHALERAQLPADRALLRRFPHQFSGGQRQRVALAQVLACGPRALVLDEPGTGLDPATRLAVAAELAELAGHGVTVLLLSHDHALVRRLAHHAVRLEDGRVTATGTPDDVLPPATPVSPRPRRAARPAHDAGSVTEPYDAEPVPEPHDAGPVTGARDAAPETAQDAADRLVPEARTAPANASPPSPAYAAEKSPASTPTPLLQTHRLDAWLGARRRGPVLHAVDLALRAGECLGVAGRSGSGKTTLARCLAGLHERQAGGVLLDGEPLPVLRDRSPAQRRRVQYVWQEVRGSFDERRTVLDQVARTAVRLRGSSGTEAVREAAAVLDRLGVAAGTADRPPAGLSGGELQRAALARALLAAPDVLLCDEITSALDAAATDLVTAEVARLRAERGTAVLWIGHDLPLLRSVADRVAVLDAGRITEEGHTEDVLTAPRTEAARLLLAAAPRHARTGPAGAAGTGGRETHTEGVT